MDKVCFPFGATEGSSTGFEAGCDFVRHACAADAVRAFRDQDVETGLREAVCRDETTASRADDDDVPIRRHKPPPEWDGLLPYLDFDLVELRLLGRFTRYPLTTKRERW
jgi:hypothetical protein